MGVCRHELGRGFNPPTPDNSNPGYNYDTTTTTVSSYTSDVLSTQSSSTNMAARRFSPFRTVFTHLYALLTVSLVLGLSTRHYVCKTLFVADPLSEPLIPLPDLSRVINSLLTRLYSVCQPLWRSHAGCSNLQLCITGIITDNELPQPVRYNRPISIDLQ